MKAHRVVSARAIDDHTLLIEFENSEHRRYDITPLLEKDMFSPLRDPELFKSVKVDQGGYAVVWNNEIDLSEYELWQNGQPL